MKPSFRNQIFNQQSRDQDFLRLQLKTRKRVIHSTQHLQTKNRESINLASKTQNKELYRHKIFNKIKKVKLQVNFQNHPKEL